ncbi:MAG: PadR family transcriptional regulator [Gemmatimonadetes bacterium]|nr:PadR family transcriptional regulator [Gemmatimonadota bacterium]
MAKQELGLIQGTLDFLVLRTLSGGTMHGFEIARWIQNATEDVLRVEEGTLYPALHRLARRGLIDGEWGVSDRGRRAKFYRLTAAGRKALQREARDWSRFVAAVNRVVEASEP